MVPHRFKIEKYIMTSFTMPFLTNPNQGFENTNTTKMTGFSKGTICLPAAPVSLTVQRHASQMVMPNCRKNVCKCKCVCVWVVSRRTSGIKPMPNQMLLSSVQRKFGSFNINSHITTGILIGFSCHYQAITSFLNKVL